MGDVILALPAARALKLTYPDAKLVFLCQHYTAPLLSLCPWLDGVIEVDHSDGQVLDEIRGHKFDVAVCLWHEPKVVRLLAKAKIPLRVGLGMRIRSVRFHRRWFEHRKWALRHEVYYNLNIARLAGIKGIPEPLWEWVVPSEAASRIERILIELDMAGGKKPVVLHPGSGKSAAEWSLERFAELGTYLKDKGNRILMTGAAQERAAIDEVCKPMGIPNLAGEISIPELAALFRKSVLVIANSTGPLHLANALGTPVIGLYPLTRSMNPRRWGPLGQMDHVLTPNTPNDGMESISVDRVARLADRLVSEGERAVISSWHKTPALSVLITITCPWWNAAAYIAIGLASALKARGHQVWVMGQADTPALKKASDLGVATIALPLHRRDPVSIMKNIRHIKLVLKDLPITIVNAHCPMGHSQVAAALFGMGRNTPVIRTVCDPRLPKRNLVNRWLHLKQTDAVIVTCGASSMRYIESFPGIENRVSVIPGGIDPAPFLDIEQPHNDATNQEIWVGVISRLSPVKGHDVFLKAAAIVSKKAPTARFLISGEAAQIIHDDLKNLSESLGIKDKVQIQDRVNDVRDILKKLHIGVVSSVGSEPMCRIALEMMASGLPVVGTNINAVGESVLDGVTGFVVPPNDPDRLAEALLKLINNPDLRVKVGQTGRKRVTDELSMERMVERVETLYRQVLCRRTSEYMPIMGGSN
jgi:ADP-heptose:LPS heptosyltransferase/glycosyltransferase involved in cell wall biosynthesis